MAIAESFGLQLTRNRTGPVVLLSGELDVAAAPHLRAVPARAR